MVTLSALLYAAYKSVRCLQVTSWGYPGPWVLYQAGVNSSDLNRQWAAHLLVSRARNDSIVKDKAGWLREAQAWYLFGLLLLFLTAVALLFLAVFGTVPQDNPVLKYLR